MRFDDGIPEREPTAADAYGSAWERLDVHSVGGWSSSGLLNDPGCRHWRDELIERLSQEYQALSGAKHTKGYTSLTRAIHCVETGDEWPNAHAASEDLKVLNSHINQALAGGTCLGAHFRYSDAKKHPKQTKQKVAPLWDSISGETFASIGVAAIWLADRSDIKTESARRVIEAQRDGRQVPGYHKYDFQKLPKRFHLDFYRCRLRRLPLPNFKSNHAA